MSIANDLLAALGSEVQAAGPGEVDEPSPASTRGRSEGSGPAGRSQTRFVLVDTAPAWPTSWDPMRPWPTWDAWRAEVARRRDVKDQLCGAASSPYMPDSDEVELEQKRTWEWLHVVDGDGVEWLNVPPFELEDLPQPVTVLERVETPVYRKPKPAVAPIVRLAEVTLKKRVGKPPKMDERQVARALARIDAGQSPWSVAKTIWRQHDFSSAKSCETSLRRQLALRREREEVAA